MPSNNEANKLYARIVARAWSDENFKLELATNPNTVLSREYGIAVPPGVQVVVRENTAEQFFLAIDAAPASAEAQLQVEQLSASSCFGTAGSLGTAGTACGCFGTVACLGTAGSWDI